MCIYCKDFNEEKEDIEISEVIVEGLHYQYHCPLKHCPNCGEKLKIKEIEAEKP